MSDQKLQEVRLQLEDVTNVMKDNINKAIGNKQSLEVIEKKSEELTENSDLFRIESTKLKRKLCWKNCQFTFLVVVIIGVILLCIILPIALKN
jgi:hypothetical protein